MSARAVAEAIVQGLHAGQTEIFVGVTRWIPLLSRIAPGFLEHKMNAS